jgi:hypothetical protein
MSLLAGRVAKERVMIKIKRAYEPPAPGAPTGWKP